MDEPVAATPRHRPRVGVFVCHCGINIAGVVKIPELMERV